MMGWQWHQLDHMQIICTSLQTDNHASKTTQFLQAGCPSCHPVNSVKALKARTVCKAVKKKYTMQVYKYTQWGNNFLAVTCGFMSGKQHKSSRLLAMF